MLYHLHIYDVFFFKVHNALKQHLETCFNVWLRIFKTVVFLTYNLNKSDIEQGSYMHQLIHVLTVN